MSKETRLTKSTPYADERDEDVVASCPQPNALLGEGTTSVCLLQSLSRKTWPGGPGEARGCCLRARKFVGVHLPHQSPLYSAAAS